VTILKRGKLATAGTAAPGFGLKPDFAPAYYDADGGPDTSFSATGQITSSFGGQFDSAKAAAF
jgi:hypothetical protein